MTDRRSLCAALLLAGSFALTGCSQEEQPASDPTTGTVAAVRNRNNDDPANRVPVSQTVAAIKQERALKWLKSRGIRPLKNDAGQPVRLGCPKSTTDEAAQRIAALTSLESLVLNRTQLTDAGLEPLAQLGNVESLVVGFSSVGDVGMQHVSHMRGLRVLTVQRTHVGDAGVAALSTLPRLEALKLTSCPVTDAGLSHVAKMKTLRYLKLTYVQVTDAGLMQLAELDGLKRLIVAGAGITPAGVEKLRRALPKCEVQLLNPSDGCMSAQTAAVLAGN